MADQSHHPETAQHLSPLRILKGPGFSSTEWSAVNSCWGGRSNDIDMDHLCFVRTSGKNGQLEAGNFDTCCLGHRADDQIYVDFPDGRDSHTIGITNRQALALVEPRIGPNFDYPVYQHFRWDHCERVSTSF